jgi:hypothetical protein
MNQDDRTTCGGEGRRITVDVFTHSAFQIPRFTDVQGTVRAAEEVDEPHCDDDAIVGGVDSRCRESLSRDLESLRTLPFDCIRQCETVDRLVAFSLPWLAMVSRINVVHDRRV